MRTGREHKAPIGNEPGQYYALMHVPVAVRGYRLPGLQLDTALRMEGDLFAIGIKWTSILGNFSSMNQRAFVEFRCFGNSALEVDAGSGGNHDAAADLERPTAGYRAVSRVRQHNVLETNGRATRGVAQERGQYPECFARKGCRAFPVAQASIHPALLPLMSNSRGLRRLCSVTFTERSLLRPALCHIESFSRSRRFYEGGTSASHTAGPETMDRYMRRYAFRNWGGAQFAEAAIKLHAFQDVNGEPRSASRTFRCFGPFPTEARPLPVQYTTQ
ncbi:hypothetical protein PMIN01_12080 [Paraphaeosphaeria minitans]|uniref:Uncharacterized protein n=1 Tax=Paraphaeosphaeria minitans TaxID=565426 RepID=A0A9P6KKS4_9PLEO|nr:hypothetical protein PMIN01_12080 [Paraphaeosphaeria minitans]